ncbi:MAG: hypothetical protein ACI4L9_02330 [Candidatus Coproplasma sp.]
MDENKTAGENCEEKTEGKVAGFLKKVKKNLNDATYDVRLAGDFEKKHKKYTVYTGASILSVNPEISVEEHYETEDNKYLIMLGEDDDIKVGCLIKNHETGVVRHIVATEHTTLTIEFEGKTNVKDATRITLGDKAEKVDVIKVDNDFYLI